MSEISGILRADGLSFAEREAVEALLDVYDRTRARNESLEDYFEGDVMTKDIGVKVIPPEADVHVDLSCDWAKKAVKALSSLVRFDGFVFEGGERDAGLDAALARCNHKAAFARMRVGMLKKGCMFATVNSEGGRANVRFHSADSGAAIMDVANERMASGLVIADSRLISGAGGAEVDDADGGLSGRHGHVHRGADAVGGGAASGQRGHGSEHHDGDQQERGNLFHWNLLPFFFRIHHWNVGDSTGTPYCVPYRC